MIAAYWILSFVVVQRLFELVLSSRNTRRLLASGGREYAPEHYKWIVALHTGWFIALFWAVSVEVKFSPILIGVFVVLQLFRGWILFALGPYWTTRIIRPRGNPIVQKGPYRFFKHPNYAIVLAEVFVLPLALGWPSIALIFTALNLWVLSVRIREENRALRLAQ